MANAGTVEIEFAAEVAKFTASLKTVQSSLKRLEGDFQSANRVASVALRVFSGAALISFARQAFNAADAIGDAAERAGIAVETFSRLKFAAEQNDVEFGALTTGIRKFQVELSKAADGGTAASGVFAQIGLNAQKLKGLALEQQLGAIADAFTKIQSPADRVRVATELFGKTGSQLGPLLAQGSAGIAKLAAEADRLGITMSGTTAAGVDQADKAIKRLKATLEGFAARFAAGLSLAILGSPDEQQQLEDQIRKLEERRARLEQGNFGRGSASTAGKSAARAEIEAINKELDTLIAKQKVALGLFTPGPSGGPGGRQPGVNIRSPLQEFDLAAIDKLKIPDDPFGLNVDEDVQRAKAQEEFRNATLTLQEEFAQSQKLVEQQITTDTLFELNARTAAYAAHQQSISEGSLQIQAVQDAALANSLAALQAFAGGSKKIAITLVAIQKGKALAEAFMLGKVAIAQAAATGPPPFNIPAIVKATAFAALNVAAIAATAFGQIKSINADGGAVLGSPVNPIATRDSDADKQSSASSRPAVQVIVTGNIGFTQQVIDQIAAGLREATDEREVLIFGPNSRQAQEIAVTG